VSAYTPSDDARAAIDYFNSLPLDERRRLAPLLENYRQMGIAEALDDLTRVSRRLTERVAGIWREGNR
jgi:hypothetical protein